MELVFCPRDLTGDRMAAPAAAIVAFRKKSLRFMNIGYVNIAIKVELLY